MTQLDRKQTPVIQAMDNFKVANPEKVILDNGIPLYIVNKGTQDLVRISLILEPGHGTKANHL